ncbi:hypothetical protein CDAR_512601 [Caerostris darwini]|uniref:Uncharacterized protein n=1 Tax=Caerostris darwini TaxID=1538125 RepID=A0AAV4T2L3_9ARAC|nr:hypothetical protein CDAR_512601 [Caerostris darwini]
MQMLLTSLQSWQHLRRGKLLLNNFIRCPETGRCVQSSSQINLRGCSLRIFFFRKKERIKGEERGRLTRQLLWENMADIEAVPSPYWRCIRQKEAQHVDAHYRGGRRYGSFG